MRSRPPASSGPGHGRRARPARGARRRTPDAATSRSSSWPTHPGWLGWRPGRRPRGATTRHRRGRAAAVAAGCREVGHRARRQRLDGRRCRHGRGSRGADPRRGWRWSRPGAPACCGRSGSTSLRLHDVLTGVTLRIASDVDNPLLGPEGAAAVYGAAEGRRAGGRRRARGRLTRWADLVAATPGRTIATHPGAGAAGGAGSPPWRCSGAELRSGVGTVLDLVGFDDAAVGGGPGGHRRGLGRRAEPARQGAVRGPRTGPGDRGSGGVGLWPYDAVGPSARRRRGSPGGGRWPIASRTRRAAWPRPARCSKRSEQSWAPGWCAAAPLVSAALHRRGNRRFGHRFPPSTLRG